VVRDVLVEDVGLSVQEALRRKEEAVSGPARVVMEYHHEPEGWWARSEDLPGFTAVGATYDEVRELAHSGAAFSLERPVEVEDRPPRMHRGAGGSV
jgi:predicted RNase H-like HicB family nuclease